MSELESVLNKSTAVTAAWLDPGSLWLEPTGFPIINDSFESVLHESAAMAAALLDPSSFWTNETVFFL